MSTKTIHLVIKKYDYKMYVDYDGVQTVTTLFTPNLPEFNLGVPHRILKNSFKYTINISKGNDVLSSQIKSLSLLKLLNEDGFSMLNMLYLSMDSPLENDKEGLNEWVGQLYYKK